MQTNKAASDKLVKRGNECKGQSWKWAARVCAACSGRQCADVYRDILLTHAEPEVPSVSGLCKPSAAATWLSWGLTDWVFKQSWSWQAQWCLPLIGFEYLTEAPHMASDQQQSQSAGRGVGLHPCTLLSNAVQISQKTIRTIVSATYLGLPAWIAT